MFWDYNDLMILRLTQDHSEYNRTMMNKLIHYLTKYREANLWLEATQIREEKKRLKKFIQIK